MPTNDNEAILARMRGLPAKRMTRLEAMMDPTNPNVYEANDNDPVTPSCGCVLCDLELWPEEIMASVPHCG